MSQTGQPTTNKGTEDDRFLWQSWSGVIGSLGLTSILIVIIGRLWTTAYFDHFGLPSSGMEFSVYDFAFRSLEALISLFLGAIGFGVAWLMRRKLQNWGFRTAFVELLLIAVLLVWVFFVLPKLPHSWHAKTGVLGVSSGLALAVMAWFGVDLWAGPGGGVENWPRWLKGLLKPKKQGEQEELARFKSVVAYGWRVIAVIVFLAIGFIYLPIASEWLAHMDAAADVATRRLAAATLQSEVPLPTSIASSGNPAVSDPVRVILTQSENTYVLHSTTCRTVGEGRPGAGGSSGGSPPAESLKVCDVVVIPTRLLRSIEYLHARGDTPPNDSPLHPHVVGLDKPFEESFSTEGASDEAELQCGEGIGFFNSIWFEFTPATDGAVFAKVETGEFTPLIGIWQASEGSTKVQSVPGSGEDASACEADAEEVPIEESAAGAESNVEKQTNNVVAVIANVRANTRYVASVGAQENRGGLAVVFVEFTPGGYFFNRVITEVQEEGEEDVGEVEAAPTPETRVLAAVESPVPDDLVSQAQELVPRIEIVSGVGTATLELWRLNPQTYGLEALAEISQDIWEEFLPGDFFLVSDGASRQFNEKGGEEQPAALSAAKLMEGVWKLVPPKGFHGLTRLTSTVDQADLVLAFANTSGTPLGDARVQQALLLVLERSEIREELGYGGDVIFDPESLKEGLQIPPVLEDREFGARLLIEAAGYGDGFPIQIQVEWESETLDAAAEIVQQRLLAIGLHTEIRPCTDACIRVFFRSKGER